MSKILISTFGSLGDLHPYLALGAELRRRGHQVTLATAATYAAKVKAHDLDFCALGPRDLTPDDPELTARAFQARRGIEYLHREIVFPHVRQGYADMDAVAAGMDLMLTGSLSYVAPLIAERRRILWASSILQPSGLLSRQEPLVPPFLPGLRRQRWVGPRLRDLLIRGFLRGAKSWQRPLDELRQELGLPADPRPFFESMVSPALHLALFSPIFGPPQTDWPTSTRQTGFVFSDKREPTDQSGVALLDFMRRGPAPVVFTLGSAAVLIAGDFYETAARVARRLGTRAVLLVGPRADELRGKLASDDVFVQDYAPFSEVLPFASVVVHQCGVGTCAQVLRAGRPSLAVPFGVDQFDNGARLERFGVGGFLPIRRFDERRASAALAAVLSDGDALKRADVMAQALRREDGLGAAVDQIEGLLSDSRRSVRGTAG